MRDYRFVRQPASPPTGPVMYNPLHPDAELLFAWDAYTAAATAFECTPGDDAEHYVGIMDALGERIEKIEARTMEGVSVQLRYLFTHHMDGSKDAWDAAVHDEDVSDALADTLKGNRIGRVLWTMIQTAQRASRMGGAA